MKIKSGPAFIVTIIFSLFSTVIVAQQTQFTLSGSAISLGDSCFQLTPNSTQQVGSLWSTNKVSLSNSFEIFANINFGNKDDDGADGMTFSLQSVSNTVGSTGNGLGMAGIYPSFFVEFDTYQNSELGDPAYDHIAIFTDGVVDHNTTNNLAGPDSISATSANIEDGLDHLLHIKWDAEDSTFQVYIDCVLRESYTGNIVNNVFGGNPSVYWGFTGSTGALTNEQSFCFLYIFFEGTDQFTICKGDSVQLHTYPGTYFNWRPYAGLNHFDIQNPIATPDTTTIYFVKYTNLCGETRYDTTIVTVRQPTFVTDTTFICQGDSSLIGNTYETASGTYITDTLSAPDFCDSLIYQTYLGLYSLPDTVRFDTTFCPPDDFTLSVYQDSSVSYNWSTGDSGPQTTVNAVGDYYVDITKSGCTSRSHFKLTQGDYCTVEIKPINIFTPNGDGKNDFFPGEYLANVQNFKMTIYNRWGQEVYTSDSMAEPWDGTVAGQAAAAGVYYFVITYGSKYNPNEHKDLKGSLTLMR